MGTSIRHSRYCLNLLAVFCVCLSSIQCKDDNPDLLLAAFLGDSAVSIRLIHPTDGESWPKGETRTIQWQAQKTYDGFDIYLFKGSTNVRTIVQGVSDSSFFAWTIPNSIVDDSQYRIRIIAHGSGAYLVVQSGEFRIYSP